MKGVKNQIPWADFICWWFRFGLGVRIGKVQIPPTAHCLSVCWCSQYIGVYLFPLTLAGSREDVWNCVHGHCSLIHWTFPIPLSRSPYFCYFIALSVQGHWLCLFLGLSRFDSEGIFGYELVRFIVEVFLYQKKIVFCMYENVNEVVLLWLCGSAGTYNFYCPLFSGCVFVSNSTTRFSNIFERSHNIAWICYCGLVGRMQWGISWYPVWNCVRMAKPKHYLLLSVVLWKQHHIGCPWLEIGPSQAIDWQYLAIL